MQKIDERMLDELSASARQNPRLRLNRNLHADYGEPCQRLLNAVEPGTYIRPHRHLTPPKPECFVAVRGRTALVVFDDEGGIEQILPLEPGGRSTPTRAPPEGSTGAAAYLRSLEEAVRARLEAKECAL